MPSRQRTFEHLLAAFSASVEANDGAALGNFFTPEGTYVDELFGAFTGRQAIAGLLQRFHDTGRDYRWEFIHPLSDGRLGYARFRFSFSSRLPDSDGNPAVFEGISQFRFAPDGLIVRYSEAFDRGVALVQLGFPAERIRRIVERAATGLRDTAEARAHLARFGV